MLTNEVTANEKEEPIIVCPHCDAPIVISKLNCGIFRHAVMKSTGKQVEPHASKEICERLIQDDAIYGCGKPFQIILWSNEAGGGNKVYKIQICEYI